MAENADRRRASGSSGVSTMAVHAGEDRQKFGNAITDPIFCASTYTFASTQAVIDFLEQKQPREEYGRYGNPERESGRTQAWPRSKEGRRPCCSPPACRRSSAC